MCLKCHGDVNNAITPPTLQAIHTLYPDDQATGYQTNQVRGIWKISWANAPVEDPEH